MEKLKIAIKNKNKITSMLEEQYEVEYDQEQTFLEKLMMKTKVYPDIYFHQGTFNTKAKEQIESARIVIVNTNQMKDEILEKVTYIKPDKIHVVYPYLVNNTKYDKEIKNSFKEQHNIPSNHKIIYFTGKNLIQSGVDKFLHIIFSLDEKKFKVIIDTDEEQAAILKNKVTQYELQDKVLILENYENKDELFIASDIFILPTKQRLFVPNVLKAMYYQNAVFVMRANPTSEIIDSFSLILSESDLTVNFKIDALIANKDELKEIQKENKVKAKEFSLKKSFKKIVKIIEKNLEN